MSERSTYSLVSTLVYSTQFVSFIFYLIFFILAGNQDYHKSSDEFEFRPDRTVELAALERLEKSLYTCNGRNLVPTLVPSFLNVYHEHPKNTPVGLY